VFYGNALCDLFGGADYQRFASDEVDGRISAMLAAGLAGLEGEYELAPEASNNIYEMTEHQREVAGIRSLPEDLIEGRSTSPRAPTCSARRSETTSWSSFCATSGRNGTPTSPTSRP
jgi:hypothetical protein